jgi:rRNA small subunit pseudouridine methyltransferase Nep1
MIWIVLAEAALEIVPPELWDHPAVIADTKRQGVPVDRLLLDTNYHHAAMHGFEDREKRGRPDIVHFCLLSTINTPLNKLFDQLRVCIHVVRPAECLIQVDPSTRVPRSLNRFAGVIVKVLAGERAATDDADGSPDLFSRMDVTLADFIARFDSANVHGLSRHGTAGSFYDAAARIANPGTGNTAETCLVIGGFQGGTFSPATLAAIPEGNLHSLAPVSLDAWTACARAVFIVEQAIAGLLRLDPR